MTWDYKLNLRNLHEAYTDGEISFNEYVTKIVTKVNDLKNRVRDNTLKHELESWIDDMGGMYDGKFECVLDEGDEDELEYRLNDLYDIGDALKRVWFGGM
jgi:hypothetical protein